MPQAFVVMQIGNAELDDLCRSAIFPAIRACGMEPRRVDRHNEGGLLKSEIIKFIQESDIIIADLTNERPNVYLEIGYAMGIDKLRNLILTVREDHFPESANHQRGGPKVHFDLAGYDILRWNAGAVDAFKNELELRIKRRLAIVTPRPLAERASTWDLDWINAHRAAALEGLGELGRPAAFMEVRAAVQPPKPYKTQVELNEAARDSQIETFGWPIAVYLDTNEFRPRPRADGIVAVVASTSSKDSFDYWSIRRNGDLYILASLFEDERPKGSAGQAIYFDTRINRLTETILYCIRLYTRLGVDRSSLVSLVVRHGGLRGRVLRASGNRFMLPRRPSDEDEVETEVTASLDELEARLVDKVIDLAAPLFQVFDFTKIDRGIYEQIVNGFVAGRIV